MVDPQRDPAPRIGRLIAIYAVVIVVAVLAVLALVWAVS